MTALCQNADRDGLTVAIQTFFVPTNLGQLQLAELPVSADLSVALKKLGLKTLGEETGMGMRTCSRKR